MYKVTKLPTFEEFTRHTFDKQNRHIQELYAKIAELQINVDNMYNYFLNELVKINKTIKDLEV